MNVLPTVVDDETDAKVFEVPMPEPKLVKGELMYPLSYGSEQALTKNKAEWESWLRDTSLAPLPKMLDDRAFVLNWCHQFAQYEPEEVGLILMNYFDFDKTYTSSSNPWYYKSNPQIIFVNWEGLRKCITDRRLVCAGYAQLFYLIVKEEYPDVKYIICQNGVVNHARNYLDGDHWDITWLDDEGVDYNPDKIKFDFIGMQDRIANSYGVYGSVNADWKVVNLIEGKGPW
ncbi:MAG: hypothetical protein LBQ88_04070 [Treponema sp.]|jgi:hypothetical protein|nr:hypothetical protein [Treponema sp.]